MSLDIKKPDQRVGQKGLVKAPNDRNQGSLLGLDDGLHIRHITA
ncbi:hypothetical protein HMF8227_02963 [Saliniradius amylolyticus]|uniref:Uncharacterized protein n=1 Tax=Saliniradius amylolyticus TaxID=2183582 RepID=A0A2S2E6Y5_9ALTE|nr:hypothetical protein HMF8227_02963 [Saliniradius amylolyticus]